VCSKSQFGGKIDSEKGQIRGSFWQKKASPFTLGLAVFFSAKVREVY
jgi:hypothetical protein